MRGFYQIGTRNAEVFWSNYLHHITICSGFRKFAKISYSYKQKFKPKKWIIDFCCKDLCCKNMKFCLLELLNLKTIILIIRHKPLPDTYQKPVILNNPVQKFGIHMHGEIPCIRTSWAYGFWKSSTGFIYLYI